MTEIIVAVIMGGLSLAGVIITNMMGNRKIERKLEVSQAITDTKIEELTREVREHNNFARRMPVVENKIEYIEDEIKVLEGYHR